MNDLSVTYPVILGSVGIAFVIGLIYLLLLRICSGLIVWAFIIGMFIGELALAYMFYNKSLTAQTS